ncbi:MULTISPECIES: serine/threonine-protein kinase [Cyanophyceae]|uniref:non-specific serine/threonine protein kinase n=1 Tax=Leptolyngbya subtilissima DQ-A4 TaxID=2933933 RepID=A0ABV0K3W4_9CYAN|nr:serine/threonine-protein kinase [Nodosilinea sp. FACHB-141]MBD2113454.1 protein kinase [Nodosilinea sp. FACHB-141]
MHPTLTPGTTLQNRYRVLQELGHGGFGRTYLAEDLGRFNERCAVKELEPQQGDQFSDKALQLFQREAAILYSIEHPQIPKFQAIFEENQRLFLVQDYIDGVTYRDLLNQRIQQGMAFSEAEVRQFLQQILPVLAHIHSKGIIHRDISPDNVMQRQADSLPVLIDFGVVKEVVTRIQPPGTLSQATSVGKLGYAPSEQMQSGRAYPSSDLYALAVTAIVLLTGKEPQEIFDDVNLSWHLPSTLSPGLIQVLRKATSYRPGDRYQSVSEMAQALGAVGTAPGPAAASTPSQVRTVAVGRQYQPTKVGAATQAPNYTAPVPVAEPATLWENPWAVAVIGGILALLAGLGGWTLVSLLNRTPAPTPVPTPEITLDPQQPQPTPEPTAEPTPETSPVEYSQNLAIQPGSDRTVRGSLRSNETINYRLNAAAGQVLLTRMTGEGVLITVLTPEGEPVDSSAQRVLNWQGTLPVDGEYIVQLRPVQGLEQSDYELEVSLSDQPDPEATVEPDPEPSVEPQPPVEPEPETEPGPNPDANVVEQRVQIPPGQTSVQVSGQVNEARSRRYIVNAQEGQVLALELPSVSGPVTLDVRFPNGELIPDASRVLSWQGQLPSSGDYIVDVSSPRPSNYVLTISAN